MVQAQGLTYGMVGMVWAVHPIPSHTLRFQRMDPLKSNIFSKYHQQIPASPLPLPTPLRGPRLGPRPPTHTTLSISFQQDHLIEMMGMGWPRMVQPRPSQPSQPSQVSILLTGMVQPKPSQPSQISILLTRMVEPKSSQRSQPSQMSILLTRMVDPTHPNHPRCPSY